MPNLKDIMDAFSTRDFIAVMLSSALVALTFVLALRSPDSDAFKVLLGALLSTGFSSAINYYFSSSKSSDKKDDIIATNAVAAASAGSAATAPTTTTVVNAREGTAETTTSAAAPPAETPKT